MKIIPCLLLCICILFSCQSLNNGWIKDNRNKYTLFYSSTDLPHKADYSRLIDTGMDTVTAFFGNNFRHSFDVLIHPTRISFDTALRKAFHDTAFRSDCWLVATGTANAINILSPEIWDKEICDSRYTLYADKIKTQKLITHELVHVFHGQQNMRRDFYLVSDIDWFTEGVAFYVSGQLDTTELIKSRKAVIIGNIPSTLDSIASFSDIGLRYSLLGSIARFIDMRYGKEKLKQLLVPDTKSKILNLLQTNEQQLLRDWMVYMREGMRRS